MEISQHTSADRITVAKLCGAARRHGASDPLDQAAAVAELREISTDTHLLAHAAAGDPAEYYHAKLTALLGAVGADLHEAAEIYAARHRGPRTNLGTVA
jgi:hypothetical protein